MKLRPMAVACALTVGAATAIVSTGTWAQSQEDTKKQIEDLQRQLQILKDRLDKQEAEQKAQAAKPAAAPGGHEFLERKPGDGVTFFTRGGEASFYGNLDVSIENTTKGIGGMTCNGATDLNCGGGHTSPIGNGNHMTAISSNISYLGIRGFQTVGSAMPFNFVYQLETGLELSAVSGTRETNSNTSDQVNGGLTSRNTYIGIANPTYGALKIGKTDTPYKNSTARMNPFSGMLGDYSVIMGNTGGDNRTEFAVPRMEHSIWYESPRLYGVNFDVLYSPGQNRAYDSSNIPAGQSDCSGGNVPGSGNLPVACNDGAFSDAFSADIAHTGKLDLGGFVIGTYVTGAYEMHRKVNRTSDITDITAAPHFDQGDVADERAWKIGTQLTFPTRTSFSFIWEDMKRQVPGYLLVQNERTRTGYWFALTQEITDADTVAVGWAHANKTPGDPGQHNAAVQDFCSNGVNDVCPVAPDGTQIGGYPAVDNSANMFTAMARHRFDRNFSVYADWAATINHRYGHYDLGAGGRSVTTDCHDASNPDTTGFDPNGNGPRCWTGGHLIGLSVGMNYRF